MKTKSAVFPGCLQRNVQFSKHRCLELKTKIAVFSGCLQRNAPFSGLFRAENEECSCCGISAGKCAVFSLSLLGAENEDCMFSGCLQRNAQLSHYCCLELKTKGAFCSGCL